MVSASKKKRWKIKYQSSCQNEDWPPTGTRALLRLERTMNSFCH